MRTILLVLLLFVSSSALAKEEFRLIDLKAWGDTEYTAHVRWEKKEVLVGYVDGPIRFYGKENCQEMVPLDRLLDNNSLDQGSFHQEVMAGLRLWEVHVPFRFRFTPNSGEADILIGAQAKPRRAAFASIQYDYTAEGRYKPMRAAAICLNPEETWLINAPAGHKEGYDLRYTIAHEGGHAIGIDHTSDKEVAAVMAFRYNSETLPVQLTETDILAAQTLYPQELAARQK